MFSPLCVCACVRAVASFIYDVFKESYSRATQIMILVSNESQRVCKGQSCPNVGFYPCIFSKELRKIKIIFRIVSGPRFEARTSRMLAIRSLL